MRLQSYSTQTAALSLQASSMKASSWIGEVQTLITSSRDDRLQSTICPSCFRQVRRTRSELGVGSSAQRRSASLSSRKCSNEKSVVKNAGRDPRLESRKEWLRCALGVFLRARTGTCETVNPAPLTSNPRQKVTRSQAEGNQSSRTTGLYAGPARRLDRPQRSAARPRAGPPRAACQMALQPSHRSHAR